MAARKSQPMKTIAGVGTIPQSWTVAKIGEIGRPKTPVVKTGPFGAQLQSKEFRSDGVPVLNIGNVQPGYFDIRKLDHVSPEKAQQLSTYFLNEGDLVFSRSASIGRTACCTKDMVGWLMSYHLMRLSVDQERCCPRFVMFSLMLSPVIVNQVNAITQGGTRSGINTAILENLRIAFPILETQKSIVRVIDTLDDAIEATRAVIDQTRKLKIALLQDLLTIGLPGRNKKFRNDLKMGVFPSDWKVKALDELVDSRRPICYGILMPGRGHPGGIPVVKVKDIVDGSIRMESLLLTSPSLDEEYKRSRLKEGDLLVTIRGTTGRVAIVPKCLNNGNITQDTARVSINDDIVRDFVYYSLQGKNLQDQIANHTIGQAVKGINIGEVRKLQIPMPDTGEMVAIVNLLQAVDRRLCAELELLEQLVVKKSSLSQGLLTGRIPVPVGTNELERTS